MATSPTRAIKLFGTDVSPPERQTLEAGPLSVELEAGNLRYVRYGGVEVMRAIAFVVRDSTWGTYNPAIENLRVEASDDRFQVTYDATCRDQSQAISFTARITGRADGTLDYQASATAITDFVSNRAGFVVLHGIEGVVSCPVEVLHVDGTSETSVFPRLVEPWQPFFDIRALTHEPAPGLKVTCRMDGDTFEMEDHRNWTDASFKTYFRPLAAPAPFTIAAGDSTPQSVSLKIEGATPGAAGGPAPVTVALGGPAGRMPRIGLGVHPRDAAAALEVADALRPIGARMLVCHYDPRAGHGGGELTRFKALGEALDAEPTLEAIVPCEGDYRDEVKAMAELVARAWVGFAAITVAPGPDMIAGRPFSDWPAVPPLGDLYDAARASFPGVPIGGGTYSYFTELNRRRPPPERLDFISHVNCAIVHAADDESVTETLEAVPFVIATLRDFAPDTPYRVGPSAIASRHSPFGGEPTANPGNDRITMVRMDPRQRGLLGSAFTLGYVARFAAGGVEQIALSAPVGEFGLVYHEADYAQHWYDQAGGVYPAYHVVAGMAAAADAERLAASSSSARDVQALAYRAGGRTSLWIANLVGEERQVELDGLPDRLPPRGGGRSSCACWTSPASRPAPPGPTASRRRAAFPAAR